MRQLFECGNYFVPFIIQFLNFEMLSTAEINECGNYMVKYGRFGRIRVQNIKTNMEEKSQRQASIFFELRKSSTTASDDTFTSRCVRRRASAVRRSSPIVDRRYVLSLLRYEKDCSAVAVVTRTVPKRRSREETAGRLSTSAH